MKTDERRVFEALDDPRWDARTLAGLARSTGLDENDVLKILQEHSNLIQAYSTKRYGLVFQLRERTNPTDTPFVDKALDYLSLGKRRRIA